MNRLKMRLGTKIGLGFILVLAPIMGMALFSLSQIGDMHGSLEKLVNEEGRKITLANEMSNQVAILSLSVRNIFVTRNDDYMNAEIAKIEKAWSHFDKAFENLSQLILDDEGKAIRNGIK